MNNPMKSTCTAAMIALASSAAFADDDGGDDYDSLSELTVVAAVQSDYRDRGLSLLGDEDFSTSLYANYQHSSGFFASAFAASIGDFGDSVQLDFVGGYGWKSGGFDLEVYAANRNYLGGGFELPNGRDSFYDVGANVSRDFGLVFVRGGVNYAPDGRWSAVNGDSLYFSTDIEVPFPTFTDLTIITHAGVDFLSANPDRFDWSAGLSYFLGPVELTGRYVNAEEIDGFGSTDEFVFGLGFYF